MANEVKINEARKHYIAGVLNRKQIAKLVGTTEKTLRSWILKFGWDGQKQSQTITRNHLLLESYKQLNAINKLIEEKHGGVPNKQLSDAKGVIIKEIEAFSNFPMHQYISVFSELLDWMQLNEPGKAMDMVQTTDNFIQDLAKKKGV